MAPRSAYAESKTDRSAARSRREPRKPVPPLVLPPHLKPLTGPTGPKPSY